MLLNNIYFNCFLIKLCGVLITPIELYYSNKRMIKIINHAEKEWEAFKVKVRNENSSCR